MSIYEEFLDTKTQLSGSFGFSPTFLPSFLIDFQNSIVDWSLRKGRSAIFADCGLGKTPMQLVWAENVVRHTNKPVLVLAPLAVSAQTVNEAEKFNIEVERSSNGDHHNGIVVTNYERLHYFDWKRFSGVVCDESSILKSFDGARRTEITEFMRKVPFRLLCTATAAPNDYTELGTSSEALGELGHMDVLNRFFKNDSNNSDVGRSYGEVVKWRFKGHAKIAFWKWVCSWARAIRRPSDLGFKDAAFILPELIENQHIVESRTPNPTLLFDRPAITLPEQREERRRTIAERCEKIADLSSNHNQSLIWCHLNDEADLLTELIKDGRQVKGGDSDEKKEETFRAFATGELSKLITKPKIGAWGLNFQNCNHVAGFPSHSYEQYYQGVRRCWRFGQKRPVTVDVVTTEGEMAVVENCQRKAKQADCMFSELVQYMREAQRIERGSYGTTKEELPAWL